MEAEPKTVMHTITPCAEQSTSSFDEAASAPPRITPGPTRLYGLFLWDGTGKADDPQDIPFLIRRISDYSQYQGRVASVTIPLADSANSTVTISDNR